jgi:hypothetical protein
VGEPLLTDTLRVPDCQMCKTGRGLVQDDRVQTASVLRCSECDVHVCCGKCWMLLHSYEEA